MRKKKNGETISCESFFFLRNENNNARNIYGLRKKEKKNVGSFSKEVISDGNIGPVIKSHALGSADTSNDFVVTLRCRKTFEMDANDLMFGRELDNGNHYSQPDIRFDKKSQGVRSVR